MPTRPPTTHHDRQRQRILAIAGRLAGERGFASVRLADIAGEADMKAPALYSYFRSRDELVAEVVRGAVEALRADIAATDDPRAPTAERLRTRSRRWSHHAEEAGAGEVLLLHRAVLEADDDPVLGALVAEAVTSTRDWFLRVLRTGRRRGEIRRDVDLPVVADLLNTCFFGIEVGAAHGLVRSPGPALFDALLDAVLAHLAPEPPTPFLRSHGTGRAT